MQAHNVERVLDSLQNGFFLFSAGCVLLTTFLRKILIQSENASEEGSNPICVDKISVHLGNGRVLPLPEKAAVLSRTRARSSVLLRKLKASGVPSGKRSSSITTSIKAPSFGRSSVVSALDD